MLDQQWITIVIKLMGQSQRSITNWEKDFSDEELEALSEVTGEELYAIRDPFWDKYK